MGRPRGAREADSWTWGRFWRGPPRPPPKILSCGKRRRRGERENRRRARDGPGPNDLELAIDHLEDRGKRALVLARHRMTERIELDAVALHRAAVGDVGLARRLRHRVCAEAAVLVD